MFEGLGEAVSLFFQLSTLIPLTIGLVVGMVVALIPGIGSLAAMAILLTFTFAMDAHVGIPFLIVLLGTGGFCGAMTAILINVPGDVQNAATLLDGYPMSQQGRAGEAIGAAAVASALGALIGIGALVLMIPVIRQVVLAFGPPEMFAMTVAGVSLISVIARGNALRGLVSGFFGMALGFIGISQTLGVQRWTFRIPDLYDGLPIVPLIIGLFALPELYELLRHNRAISKTGRLVKGGVAKGMFAVIRRPAALIRGSLVGVGVGVVPGVGASVAPWVSYSMAQAASKDPASFGKGNIEGVIAPEASNDSKDGGALMPLLAFGVPGSLSMAIILSAFQFHGVVPGARLFREDMWLIWLIILALLFANFGSSILGIALANVLVKITLVPAIILGPIVMAFALAGSYADHRRLWSIFLAVGMGFVGLLMARAGFPRAPLLVGYVLLTMVERFFHQSRQLSRGSYEFLMRPITFGILAVVAITLLSPLIGVAYRKLKKRYAREGQTALSGLAEKFKIFASPGNAEAVTGEAAPGEPGAATDAADPAASVATDDRNYPSESPPAGLAVSALILGYGILLLTTYRHLDDRALLFPNVVLYPMVAMALALIVMDLRRLLKARAAGDPIFGRPGVMTETWVTGWFLLMPLLLWMFGILIGSGLYVLLARMYINRKRPARRETIQAVILSAGTMVGIQLVFAGLLRVNLPTGLFY